MNIFFSSLFFLSDIVLSLINLVRATSWVLRRVFARETAAALGRQRALVCRSTQFLSRRTRDGETRSRDSAIHARMAFLIDASCLSALFSERPG